MHRDEYGLRRLIALFVGFIVVIVVLSIVRNSAEENAALRCIKYNYGEFCRQKEALGE